MKEEIKRSADVLRNGGIILYPTDTVWGIGCDATNEAAVQKIFKIKKRNEAKSMIVLVAEAHQVSFYADEPEVAKDLVEFAEKPLTIIYPKAKGLAKSLIAEDGSIGIRVVKDEFCQQLVNFLHKPIVSTSANVSGEPSPANYAEISDTIKSSVDYVVNLRQEERGKSTPSQIIKIRDGRPDRDNTEMSDELHNIQMPSMKEVLAHPVFAAVSAAADEMGVEAYVIGGYVRDAIFGRPCKDIDIVSVGKGIDLALNVAAKDGR